MESIFDLENRLNIAKEFEKLIHAFFCDDKAVIYKDKYGCDNIEVTIKDDSVWLNQEQLVKLYNSSKSNISEHIKHIFEEHELDEDSVVRKFRTTANDGKKYNVNYYNLDMIVAIGFRVRSNIGTNFRKWANDKLTEYITKGFTINDDLLKRAGGGLYFDELLFDLSPKKFMLVFLFKLLYL